MEDLLIESGVFMGQGSPLLLERDGPDVVLTRQKQGVRINMRELEETIVWLKAANAEVNGTAEESLPVSIEAGATRAAIRGLGERVTTLGELFENHENRLECIEDSWKDYHRRLALLEKRKLTPKASMCQSTEFCETVDHWYVDSNGEDVWGKHGEQWNSRSSSPPSAVAAIRAEIQMTLRQRLFDLREYCSRLAYGRDCNALDRLLGVADCKLLKSTEFLRDMAPAGLAKALTKILEEETK